MANRKRGVQLHFMVTEREKELIQQKMEQLGTKNMGAFLRKMAIDGYVVRLDLSAVGELVSLLRRCSNNLNQLTRRAHETGNIYEADIEDLRQNYDRLWDMAGQILTALSNIR
ncbi:MAG: plasmid mobilization relaxosome protein MobC [Proteiniphilum sp.]|nr:plasmid mobilization relaxosome protein MobC [Proteiniphilum sp.]MDD3908600.1 plasmid mobilization relaxosome protein MobC [Proteiniphilum sp.]MDD4415927.1 plasmid mobilization relaxosome protein MobC [Proteiniphilum sp.]